VGDCDSLSDVFLGAWGRPYSAKFVAPENCRDFIVGESTGQKGEGEGGIMSVSISDSFPLELAGKLGAWFLSKHFQECGREFSIIEFHIDTLALGSIPVVDKTGHAASPDPVSEVLRRVCESSHASTSVGRYRTAPPT
jgi:hypothetical protein